MKLHALLTLDLASASPGERTIFDQQMANAEWVKQGTTTTWTTVFKDGVSRAEALQITKQDVRTAASRARIASLKAICMFDSRTASLFVG